jgi:hypothetical protein
MSVNLQEIDGVKVQSKRKASCHCGAVELDLPDGLVDCVPFNQRVTTNPIALRPLQ